MLPWLYKYLSFIFVIYICHLSSFQVVEQGTELATKQAMKRMNSVSAKSSPYMETKKGR